MNNKNRLVRFAWTVNRVSRRKADRAMLEDFLSVLLNDDIKIVSIKRRDSVEEHPADRFRRLDIISENGRGERLLMEVRNSELVDSALRMACNDREISEHAFIDDSYSKVYHIYILYFKMGKGDDYVYRGSDELRGIHSNTILQLTDDEKKFLGKDEVNDLHPEYFVLRVENFDNTVKTDLDEWIYYLNNTEIPENFTARGLQKARKRLLFNKLTEKEKNGYVHYLDQTNYERSSVENAYNNGRAQGKRMEAKREIVMKMLKNKMSIEDICNYTELSKTEIQELISEQADKNSVT